MMTDTRPKTYFGKILSSSCMQQIVVARITHVALPCEPTEKLTGTTLLVKSGLIRIPQTYYTNIHTFFIRIRGGEYNA